MAKKTKPLSPREADTLNKLILMENRHEENEAKAMAWADEHLGSHRASFNAFLYFIKGLDKDDAYVTCCCPEGEWAWYEAKWGWVRRNAQHIAKFRDGRKADLKNTTKFTSL